MYAFFSKQLSARANLINAYPKIGKSQQLQTKFSMKLIQRIFAYNSELGNQFLREITPCLKSAHIKAIVSVYMLLGNTRVITQSALQQFQDKVGKALKDPYKVCNYRLSNLFSHFSGILHTDGQHVTPSRSLN